MVITAGLRGEATLTVADADTALALGSGDVPVLGTPRVLALAEAATVDAVAGALDDGESTVGTRVALLHRRPSAVGRRVRAEAVLVEVADGVLRFEFTVSDGDVTVATGTVERAVVERDAFVARAQTPVVERG